MQVGGKEKGLNFLSAPTSWLVLGQLNSLEPLLPHLRNGNPHCRVLVGSRDPWHPGPNHTMYSLASCRDASGPWLKQRLCGMTGTWHTAAPWCRLAFCTWPPPPILLCKLLGPENKISSNLSALCFMFLLFLDHSWWKWWNVGLASHISRVYWDILGLICGSVCHLNENNSCQ